MLELCVTYTCASRQAVLMDADFNNICDGTSMKYFGKGAGLFMRSTCNHRGLRSTCKDREYLAMGLRVAKKSLFYESESDPQRSL